MKKFSRSLVAATAVTALLALAGCSGDAKSEPTPTKEPSATGTNTPADPDKTDGGGEEPTNTPAPTITPGANGQYEWCDPAKQAPFTGAPAAKFGAEKVMEAYCTMVELQMENSFNDALWRQSDGFVEKDFDAVREYLGQDAREDYDRSTAAVVAGTADDEAVQSVRGFVNYNFANGSGFTMDEPALFNLHFSPAKTWVDKENPTLPRLVMQFSVGADVALVRDSDDKQMAYAYEKALTFWLVPGRTGGERAWFIDGYRWERGEAQPVPREDLIKPTKPTKP